MAEIGNKICRWDSGLNRPVFGRIVFAEPEVENEFRDEDNPELLVHWEGNEMPTAVTEFPHFAYEKYLVEGERVIRPDGTVGEVIRTSQLITLYAHGTEFVIRDIPLERLRPLLNFFPGVKLHCDGWLGDVVDVQRRVLLEYPDSTQFYVNEEQLTEIQPLVPTEPGLINSAEIRLDMDTNLEPDLVRSYPYTQSSRIPFLGHLMTFQWNELKQVDWQVQQTLWAFLNRPYFLGCRYRNRSARVTAVDVRQVHVEWKKALGPNSPSDEPENLWSGQIITRLEVLPVPQNQFFYPGSLMVLDLLDMDMNSIVHVRDWEKSFCEEGLGTAAGNPAKIPRLSPPFEPNERVPVRGLLLQTTVTVDSGSGNIWHGMSSRLNRDPTDEFIPVGPPNLVAIKKRYLDPISGKFGIYQGPSGENEGFAKIQWFQELPGNAQAVLRLGLEEEPYLDLVFPEAYNHFIPGMLVARMPASARDFNYGIVQRVHRDGKLSIDINNATLEVWPFEIEECGRAPPSPSPYHPPVAHPQALCGLLRNLPDTSRTFDKWECLKKLPEGNFFDQMPDYKFGTDPSFFRVLIGELVLLGRTLPDNVWVKSYEEKINTMSVLMLGPDGTPYQDCLFVFEMYLPEAYPIRPPHVHFVKMATACLGEDLMSMPNGLLDVEGLIARLPPDFHGDNYSRVTGGPNFFTIAMVVKAIRDGVFVNNAATNREYNQEICVGILDSFYELLANAPEPWTSNVRCHLADRLPAIIQRFRNYTGTGYGYEYDSPNFPLLPLTQYAKTSLERRLNVFVEFTN